MSFATAAMFAAMAAGSWTVQPEPHPLEAPVREVRDLSWLSGDWVEERMINPHATSVTAEAWSTPLGGVMLGTNIGIGQAVNRRMGDGTIVNGVESRSFEFMRIARAEDGRITFFAYPNGGPAVPFAMVRGNGMEVVFENASNDYPQRIRYMNMHGAIMATISRMDGSDSRTWMFTSRPRG